MRKFRPSATVNSVMSTLGYSLNDDVAANIVGNAIQDLLDKGLTAKEAANYLRPLNPAFKEIVEALNEVS